MWRTDPALRPRTAVPYRLRLGYVDSQLPAKPPVPTSDMYLLVGLADAR
jgi:hypothetical protein